MAGWLWITSIIIYFYLPLDVHNICVLLCPVGFTGLSFLSAMGVDTMLPRIERVHVSGKAPYWYQPMTIPLKFYGKALVVWGYRVTLTAATVVWTGYTNLNSIIFCETVVKPPSRHIANLRLHLWRQYFALSICFAWVLRGNFVASSRWWGRAFEALIRNVAEVTGWGATEDIGRAVRCYLLTYFRRLHALFHASVRNSF